MRKLNTLFLTGTLGMAATSMLQILLDVIPSVGYPALSGLYPVFIVILGIGTWQMTQKKPKLVRQYKD